jgi:hypothetical protein
MSIIHYPSITKDVIQVRVQKRYEIRYELR